MKKIITATGRFKPKLHFPIVWIVLFFALIGALIYAYKAMSKKHNQNVRTGTSFR